MKIKEHNTVYTLLIHHDKFYKFQIKISFELKIFYINNNTLIILILFYRK